MSLLTSCPRGLGATARLRSLGLSLRGASPPMHVLAPPGLLLPGRGAVSLAALGGSDREGVVSNNNNNRQAAGPTVPKAVQSETLSLTTEAQASSEPPEELIVEALPLPSRGEQEVSTSTTVLEPETAAEVLEKAPDTVFQQAWAAYMVSLEQRPLLTKCYTSLVGFGLGDCIAQLTTEPTFQVMRLLTLGGYGFFIDAPAGNAFYNFLDKNIMPENPKSGKAVLAKIAVDQLLYAPLFTCVLYAYLKTVEGHPELIMGTLQDKVVPTLIANYAIWPLAHGLNFRYVPTEQRILYNNFVAVIWTTYLSFVTHG